MLISDIFRLATRMFRTNKSRTLLTILGIGVGIGTILFLISMGYGLQNVILGQITSSEALLSLDVTIGDSELLLNEQTGEPVLNEETGEQEILILNDDTVNRIMSIPNVERISPLIALSTQINIEDISSEISSNFASREYLSMEGVEIKSGEFFKNSDTNKIVISMAALQLFDLSEEEIYNKEIQLSFFLPDNDENDLARRSYNFGYSFKVIGVTDDELDSFIYLPFELSRSLQLDSYDQLKVKIDLDTNLDLVRNKLLNRGYAVSALSDIIEQANQIFYVAQIVLAMFGIIALLVSAIGMFNTMTITLLERTQEIGIMKALGATKMDVLSMFLAESVIIGFLGGVGGLVIGLLSGEAFNYLVNTLAGALGGERIDLFFTPLWFIITIITFSTVVGFFTGLYPARRAASINPLVALRYK